MLRCMRWTFDLCSREPNRVMKSHEVVLRALERLFRASRNRLRVYTSYRVLHSCTSAGSRSIDTNDACKASSRHVIASERKNYRASRLTAYQSRFHGRTQSSVCLHIFIFKLSRCYALNIVHRSCFRLYILFQCDTSAGDITVTRYINR